MDDHNIVRPLPQHEHGRRVDGVTHMCPDCGLPVRPFCATCRGTGQVTELELSIWQRKQNAIMAEADRHGGSL